MKRRPIVTGLILLFTLGSVMVSSASSFEMKAYQMAEYSVDPSDWDVALQYYYYIPAPTYSWFWALSDLQCGDVLGVWVELCDISQGGFDRCGRASDNSLMGLRVLDFAGYGTTYPGLFTVEFDVWCADQWGCPISGSNNWDSGPVETHFGWNYLEIDPFVGAFHCLIRPGDSDSPARMLVTATMIGTDCTYPAWGLDNVSSPDLLGFEMHDSGCLPALYPRPYTGYYPAVHTGYYGDQFSYCPPVRIPDGRDTTLDASRYGAIELAWRFYFRTWGPCSEESTYPTSWDGIKRMYR